MRYKEFGFTIPELLVTLFVLVTAFISFTTLFVAIDSVSTKNKLLLDANGAAYAKIQEYENMEFTNIPTGSTCDDGSKTNEVEDFSGSLPSSLFAPKTGKVYVVSVTQSLKLICVEVSYRDNNGNKLIEYADFIHESGYGR